jgi:beta-lactamase class A
MKRRELFRRTILGAAGSALTSALPGDAMEVSPTPRQFPRDQDASKDLLNRDAAELSLADVMHLALVVSDNDAANIIAEVVGLERVNELATELGLTKTRMQRLMMDRAAVAAGRENLTSAGDLARLLEELADGEALEPLVGERVLASLELQEHLDGIARYLPPEACYAGKCGDDSPVRRFAHDCALVSTGRRRAVLVVMTRDSGGFETVARTGAALYAALGEAAGPRGRGRSA